MNTVDGWPHGRPQRQPPNQEHDIHSTLRVTAGEAERGARVPVLLPDGRETEVQVPAGIEDGARLRLSGEGIGRKGHLFLHVHIIPEAE